MWGARFIPLVSRAIYSPCSALPLPKMQFSLLNKETTCLLARTGLLPSNITVRNILEVLEKMSEEVDQETERDIGSVCLLGQATLGMSHLAISQ